MKYLRALIISCIAACAASGMHGCGTENPGDAGQEETAGDAGQEETAEDAGQEETAEDEDQEETEMNGFEEYITPERLKAECAAAEKYEDPFLQSFIERYCITEKNAGLWNLERLLEEYAEIRTKADVNALFEEDTVIVPEKYRDVSAIAFYENKGTGLECVYYDLTGNCRYRSTDTYLFTDLRQGREEPFYEGADLIAMLDRYDVFHWESAYVPDESTDIQRMVLAVQYMDGSIYRISAEGILSKILPETYETVREYLLDKFSYEK